VIVRHAEESGFDLFSGTKRTFLGDTK